MHAAGQKTDALVEFVDIYPTLAQLAGLPLTEGLEGKSFAPLLDNPDAPWDKVAISEYPKGRHRGTAMRTTRYRYVEWKDKQGKIAARELYDHTTDPQENTNVADDPARAQVLEKLGKLLETRRHEITGQ